VSKGEVETPKTTGVFEFNDCVFANGDRNPPC
jgi:hypothetical protein